MKENSQDTVENLLKDVKTITPSKETFLLDSDTPITSSKNDRFKRSDFAKHIAHVLMHRPAEASFVLGLYGKWGAGKTSVMNIIAEEITSNKDTIIIHFNPWYFQSEEKLIHGFFQSLGEKLATEQTKEFQGIRSLLSRFSRLLSPFNLSTDILGIKINIDGKKIAELVQENESTVEEVKKEIENTLLESQKRIIVFIDDIDRLDKSETHTLFKIVKLFANFPYTTYVLAFDENIVAEALGDKYGNDSNSGQDFLDKIIQVPLFLPVADSAHIKQLIKSGIEQALCVANIKLSDEEEECLKKNFIDLEIDEIFATPRMCIRYINALMFSLALLKDEVNTCDLIILEAIRSTYPQIYKKVYVNALYKPVLYDLDKNYECTPIKSILKEYNIPSWSVVHSLLKTLFPVSNRSFDYGFEEELTRKKHIASEKYFYKYFLYGIQELDISDKNLNSLVNNIVEGNAIQQREVLQQVIDQNQVLTFFGKVRIGMISYELSKSIKLFFALHCHFDLFRNTHNNFTEYNINEFFIRMFLIILQKEDVSNEYFSLSKKIIESANNVSLFINIWQIIENNLFKKSSFSEKKINILKKLSLQRIKNFHQQDEDRIYLSQNRNSFIGLYKIWLNLVDRENINSILQIYFQKHTGDLYILLAGFIDLKYIKHSNRLKDFKGSTYDHIIKYLDADFIFNVLNKEWQIDLFIFDVEKLEVSSNWSHNKLLAYIFAYMHDLDMKQKSVSQKAIHIIK